MYLHRSTEREQRPSCTREPVHWTLFALASVNALQWKFRWLALHDFSGKQKTRRPFQWDKSLHLAACNRLERTRLPFERGALCAKTHHARAVRYVAGKGRDVFLFAINVALLVKGCIWVFLDGGMWSTRSLMVVAVIRILATHIASMALFIHAGFMTPHNIYKCNIACNPMDK